MDLKDIQIQILSKTIADLITENAELRSALIVLQNQKEGDVNGEHQDSTINESDSDKR